MSKIFTLDSFREEAEKEYATTKIDVGEGVVVTLKSLIRLNKKARDAVLAQLEALEDLKSEDESENTEQAKSEIDSLIEAATNILQVVADKPKELLKALDGDLAMLMEVLKEWMGRSQPGEAESSPA